MSDESEAPRIGIKNRLNEGSHVVPLSLSLPTHAEDDHQAVQQQVKNLREDQQTQQHQQNQGGIVVTSPINTSQSDQSEDMYIDTNDNTTCTRTYENSNTGTCLETGMDRRITPPVQEQDQQDDDDSTFTPEKTVDTLEIIQKLGGVFAWTKPDDDRLCIVMQSLQLYKNKIVWEQVAQEFGNGKSAKECFQRWTWYLSPPRRSLHKKRFTVEEDAIICNAVQSAHPAKPCWTDICKLLSSISKSRNTRSTRTDPTTNNHESQEDEHEKEDEHDPHRVRERWHNLLNPKLNKMPFSKDEDVRLYEGLRENGQKWTTISKDFFNDTRSDIQLKNRFKTVSFQQFYAKVSARVLEHERRERRDGDVSRTDPGEGDISISSFTQHVQDDDANASIPESDATSTTRTRIVKRLQNSLAAQIQGEDVPKPPPGKYFSPIGAAQILSKIGKSERRTVMKTWIDRNYVPVNLTSLYRVFGRYNNGKKLKPRWYCESRMKTDGATSR